MWMTGWFLKDRIMSSGSSEPAIELLITNDEEQAVFTYLFELQESGKTNMFGAAAYIINQPQFKDISIELAINLVKKWMDNYDALRVALVS